MKKQLSENQQPQKRNFSLSLANQKIEPSCTVFHSRLLEVRT